MVHTQLTPVRRRAPHLFGEVGARSRAAFASGSSARSVRVNGCSPAASRSVSVGPVRPNILSRTPLTVSAILCVTGFEGNTRGSPSGPYNTWPLREATSETNILPSGPDWRATNTLFPSVPAGGRNTTMLSAMAITLRRLPMPISAQRMSVLLLLRVYPPLSLTLKLVQQFICVLGAVIAHPNAGVQLCHFIERAQ